MKFKLFLQLQESYNNIIKDASSVKNREAIDIINFIIDNFQKLYGVSFEEALPLTENSNNEFKLRRQYDILKLANSIKDNFNEYSIKLNKLSFTVSSNSKIIFKCEMGEGTRNNKAGGGKRGKEFEDIIAYDLNNILNGQLTYPGIINEIYNIVKSEYGIDLKTEEYTAVVEGSKNQKRKMSFNNSIDFTPSGDIGKIITDVTIKTKTKDIYISLKYGSQYYLVNSSIRPYLHENKPNEDVKERNDILKYFGFNPKNFCEPYNLVSDDDTSISDSTIIKNWEHVFGGIIGSGYIYVIGGGHEIVLNNHKTPNIKVLKVNNIIYANEKRKYSKIGLSVNIGGKIYNVDCQFRGTTPSDILPYYLRVLVN